MQNAEQKSYKITNGHLLEESSNSAGKGHEPYKSHGQRRCDPDVIVRSLNILPSSHKKGIQRTTGTFSHCPSILSIWSKSATHSTTDVSQAWWNFNCLRPPSSIPNFWSWGCLGPTTTRDETTTELQASNSDNVDLPFQCLRLRGLSDTEGPNHETASKITSTASSPSARNCQTDQQENLRTKNVEFQKGALYTARVLQMGPKYTFVTE